MTNYGQFCAIARGLEVVGERWSLLVIRELLCGATSYSEIQRGLPRIPKATLAARLRALVSAELVVTTDGKYYLTGRGEALGPVVASIAEWASATPAAALTDSHLNPAALTWDIQRRVDRTQLPNRKVVTEIAFSDIPANRCRYWLHLSRHRVDLCHTDTGDLVDLWLTGETRPITRWWLGEITWKELLDSGTEIHGTEAMRTAFPTWFMGYVFAPRAQI